MPSTKSRSGGSARRADLKPFTVEHFQHWSSLLVLDTGDRWEVEDFQLDIVRDIFSGVREVWVVLPEGNAKTTLLAAVALYGADHSESPWIPIGAASRDQAEILFNQAGGFVHRTQGLEKRFRVYDGYRKIASRRNGGVGVKVYAADKGTADGAIPFPYAIVDEGHRHRDLGLYRTWKGKLGKRRAQIIMISTAGEPGGDFEETRDKIRDQATTRERNGAHMRASSPLVVLQEFKVASLADCDDLEKVKAANPLKMIDIPYLADKLASPTLDHGEDWLRLTCNIPSRSSSAAITDREWDDAQTADRIPEGEMVDVGLDVAWKYDCTALVPLWVRGDHDCLFGDPTILTPPRDGTMLNSAEITDAFETIHARNPIGRVVMDREKGEMIAAWLEEHLGVEVVERGRTNEPASEDYERFMEALREGWLHHTGHAELRTHAMNAVVRHLPGDRKRFDRPMHSRRNSKEQHRRVIDALDAASMVHTVAVANAPAGEILIAFG